MKKSVIILSVGVFSSFCFFGTMTARADVAVEYRVNQSELKKGTTAADNLTFSLYEDSACADHVSTQLLTAGSLTYEPLKLTTVKGGTRPTATTLIKTVLTGSDLSGPLYLKVEGPGIATAGGDCQVQAGSEPFKSIYHESSSLNISSTDVDSTFKKINNFLTFTKARNDTTVEVTFNSRVYGGTFSGGAYGVVFEIRIDNFAAAVDSQASIVNSNTSNFVSMTAAFKNLAAGSHTLSIWAKTIPTGSSTDFMLDSGGWGGRLVVKETY